jgi:hypothetical protein
MELDSDGAATAFRETGVRREPTVHWRSRPSSGADLHCRALAAPRSPRIRERGLPAESGACPQSGHIGPPVGPFSGSPAGVAPTTPRIANCPMSRASDGAPLPRVRPGSRRPGSYPTTGPASIAARRLWTRAPPSESPPRSPCPARRASDPSRRPRRVVLRGFAHAARLPGTDANSPVGTCDGACAPRPTEAAAVAVMDRLVKSRNGRSLRNGKIVRMDYYGSRADALEAVRLRE